MLRLVLGHGVRLVGFGLLLMNAVTNPLANAAFHLANLPFPVTEAGVVAYLCNRKLDVVRKLMALGLIPGAPIRLIQTFPGIVLQTGHTQLAVDKALAARRKARGLAEPR